MARKAKAVPGVTKVAEEDIIKNSLSEAFGLGNFNAFNLPQGQGFPGTEQISDVNTIFKNLRWYLVSNFRQVLNECYIELGLIQTICKVPVEDALRGGIEIKSKQLDEEQIADLQIAIDRDDDLNKIAMAGTWNRLFGGAGIIVLTDQDPEEPLNIETITEDELEFRVADMWELTWNEQNTEEYEPSIQSTEFEYYDYYGARVHKSRVMQLKGPEAPSFIRPRLRGWGFSVVETLVRSMNQYLKGTDLGFEVLDEFKVDVYKVKNLVNTLLSPNGQQKVAKRFQTANYLKNYQNAIVLDSEDDYDHKQLSFAGLAEAMEGIRMQVAADMRIPRSKLFGEAGGGLNSGSNEGDLEVYNSMVEAEVRNKIKYPILRMLEIKCQVMFGFIPDDLSVGFKPLRVLSAEQEENVKTQKFNRLKAAKDTGEISTHEFREACNKGNLFDITLDTAEDQLNPDDPEVEEIVKEGTNNPDEPKDGEDREESEKGKPNNNAFAFLEHGDTEGLRAALERPGVVQAIYFPKELTRMERVERSLRNSAAFDRASYAADGGDDWIDSRRADLFENPGNVDEALWAKAKEASEKALGEVKWQFVTWWYKKQGGKFS